MLRWHHQLRRHESEQTQEAVEDPGAWRAADAGVEAAGTLQAWSVWSPGLSQQWHGHPSPLVCETVSSWFT